MKISLITPSYNSSKTIARTIESVIAQDYADLEYIIIDGASTDDSLKIIDGFRGRIDIKLISESDKGIYDAMNKGIALASGEIIGILNSDDVFDNQNVLSTVGKAFQESGTDLVYGDIKYFKDNVDKVSRTWKTGEYSLKALCNGWTIPHPALFLRKLVYDKAGLYNTDLKIAGDYEFILRLLTKFNFKIKYLPVYLVRMYQGGTSGRNFIQRKKGWRELRRAWQLNGFKVPCCFIVRRLFSKLTQFIT